MAAMLYLVAALVLPVSCVVAELDVPEESELVLDDDFDARVLYVYNSTTILLYTGVAVALLMFGALLLATLLPAGIGTGRRRRSDDYNSGRRSNSGFHDEEPFLDYLLLLEDTFQKLRILEFGCQTRAMCEANHPLAKEKYGVVAERLQDVFSKMTPSILNEFKEDTKQYLNEYLQAAGRGHNVQDCAAIYSRMCPTSLEEFLIRSRSRPAPEMVHNHLTA